MVAENHTPDTQAVPATPTADNLVQQQDAVLPVHGGIRVPEQHVLNAGDLLSKDLAMDAVTLYVRDIDTMVEFYTKVIALNVIEGDGRNSAANDKREGVVTLGRGKTPIMVLRHEPNLPFAQQGQAGLFHTAILFEAKAALAAVITRIAQYAGSLFTGSADHLVSEAFYMNDPEGNGIELYWTLSDLRQPPKCPAPCSWQPAATTTTWP